MLVTIYCRACATTQKCAKATQGFYVERAFVRVADCPTQTKRATGSDLACISYAAKPERKLVIAAGVVDNFSKHTAG